jgi:Tol biopolymer transport system component
MMRNSHLVAVALLALLLPSPNASAQDDSENLPRLSGAIFLVGDPTTNITLTSGEDTNTVQQAGGEWYTSPSISTDGSVIATAYHYRGDAHGFAHRILATYSTRDNRWAEYKHTEFSNGTLAISPNGTTLAYLEFRSDTAPAQFHFLDLPTGKMTAGPKLEQDPSNAISWSPDGRRIAFDMEVPRMNKKKVPLPPLRAIYVLDLQNGTVSKLEDGAMPSWSPSGDWIAFYTYSPGRDDRRRGWFATNADRVSVMHPDGSESRVLAKFPKDEDLRVPSVWSPDSKSILINRLHDNVKDTMDIEQLTLASRKLKRKFKDTPPVVAWIAAK